MPEVPIAAIVITANQATSAVRAVPEMAAAEVVTLQAAKVATIPTPDKVKAHRISPEMTMALEKNMVIVGVTRAIRMTTGIATRIRS